MRIDGNCAHLFGRIKMNMKKIWSAPVALVVVLTMALFFGGITVSADEYDYGDCGETATWTLDYDGTLTISGTGAMYDSAYQEWDYYDDFIEKIVIESGITTIGPQAFNGCYHLSSVTIPATVNTIGNSAFANCSSLTSINIPASVTTIGSYAFQSSGLESITIPDSVTSLGEYAFGMCGYLDTVTIGSGLTTIPEGAFSECSTLTTVILSNTIKTIGTLAFWRCTSLTGISIPNSTTTIGDYAFKNCTALESIRLSGSLTTIGDGAFEECSLLENVTFPNTLKSIGYCAFSNTGLTSLALPSGIESIGNSAFSYCNGLEVLNLSFNSDMSIGSSLFSYCTGLQTATITGNITEIKEYMFMGCENLSSLTLPTTVTKIGNGAFSGCADLNYTFSSNITSYGNYALQGVPLNTVTISPNATYGEGVFAQNNSIEHVIVESGVTSIPGYMFWDCTNLISVDLPDTVTSIGENAFYNSGLTSIVLPKNLKTIGNYAFSKSKLATLTLNNKLESIGVEAFANIRTLKTINFSDSVTYYGNRAFACTGVTSVSLKIDDTVTENGGLFSGCTELETAVITGNTTKLEYAFFEDCRNLESVTLPENLTGIPSSCFSYCYKLTSVTLPANVESIGFRAFYSCTSLTSVTIPSKVSTIGDNAFESSGLTSIVIPDSVTNIGTGVFSICKELKTATLPSTMTAVPVACFSNCSKLSSVNFPSGLETIGESAFAGCGFTSLSIPGTVKYVDYEAFKECSKLRTVVLSEGVDKFIGQVFYNCDALETAVIASTADVDYLNYTFNYCENLKTVYCTRNHTTCTLSNDMSGINFIIITNADNIPAHIAGHSITLAADIGVNFYLALPLEYDDTNTTVEFTWGEGTDFNSGKSYVHKVNAKLTKIYEHGANYKVTCGVAARAMTDTISMVVKSGNTVVMTDTYTVMDYVNVLVKAQPDNKDLQYLLCAMCNYGSLSQQYFNYKNNSGTLATDKYDNSGDTWKPEVRSYTNNVDMTVPAENITITGIANDNLGISYYGASILCASQMKMRFYFRVTDATAFAAIKDTAYFKSQKLKFIDAVVDGQSLVYIETQGLMPGDLENVFEITVNSNVYTYDFRDYINRLNNADEYFLYTARAAYTFSHFAKKFQEGQQS